MADSVSTTNASIVITIAGIAVNTNPTQPMSSQTIYCSTPSRPETPISLISPSNLVAHITPKAPPGFYFI